MGEQSPRLLSVPAYNRTVGGEVVDFMAEVGRPLDEWLARMVIDAFAYQDDGLWAAFEIVTLVARQNGKGGFTEALELGGVFLFKEQLIMHSAHQFKTSTAAFRRLQDIIDGSDWLTKRIKTISRSKGDESIQLTPRAGGGIIQFVARTLGSGRGLTGSTTVFDEAAWLTVGQYAAQTPALSTIPNPRIAYTSTPPDDDVGPMPEDAMLPSVRKRGMAGGDRVAYYEWSPEKGADPEDPETHRRCNPAYNIRIAPWFLAKQLENFKAAGRVDKFVTEHLGAWPPDADEQWQVISESGWNAREDQGSRILGGVTVGISMTKDRNWVSIGVMGRREDGDRHAQLIEHGQGSGWVVPRMVELRDERRGTDRPLGVVVIGSSDPAKSLVPDLIAADFEVLTPGSGDMAAECGAVYDGLAGDEAARDIWHVGQPQLTDAIAGAVKKKVGDGWVWARLDAGGNTAPAYAITAASYGFRVRPPDDYAIADSVL